METPKLHDLGSLITYRDDDGQDRCLGYLLNFSEHGVYDANFGKVEITPENAETHNRLLDEAVLRGLDEKCQVGLHGMFYTGTQDGRTVIKTWCGTLVSDDCERHGSSVTFRRGGKTYRGRTSEDADLFNFRRIA